jgi:hypothetical protein
VQQHYDVSTGTNGSSPMPKVGIAGGAALGGGTLVLLARRRAKRKRAQASRAEKVEAVALTAATKAKGTATTVGSKVRDGVDRIADDRRLRTYAIVGAGAAWLVLKVAEVRQLRRLSKTGAFAR